MPNLNLYSNLAFIQTTPQFEHHLTNECLSILNKTKPLLGNCNEELASIISTNCLLNVEILKINSASHAANQLKDRLNKWVNIENENFRKAAIINKKLPILNFKPINFLTPLIKSALGHWSMIDEEHILISSACTSCVPHGIFNFIEDKINPPSRAYLKLWETFQRIGKIPNKNSICIDLGASPGGWSWVLSKLAKEVIAIDKADLAPDLLLNSKVKYIKEDILNLKWFSYLKNCSWLFCDAALSPDKIVPLFEKIILDFPNLSFICTLKQKGDFLTKETLRAAKIPGTKVLCLSNNKHELTWIKVTPDSYSLYFS
jgi:23S rRNA (cytidine2498-2'-O)-methyltransferase